MPAAEMAGRGWRGLAWQFHCLPSSYCHESWLPEGLSDAHLPARHDARHACHRYLSPWLGAQLKLDDEGIQAFDDPLRRMALLDGQALDRLQPVLGLVACQPLLCQTLDGSVLERLRAVCGLSSLGFLVAMPPPPLAPAGMAPLADLGGDSTVELLPAIGRCMLFDLAGTGQEGVSRRLRLKFPRRRKQLKLELPPVPEGARAALGPWFSSQLMPKVLPSWAWLFC